MTLNIAFCGFICSGKTCISEKLKEQEGGRIESIASPLKAFAQQILDTMQEGLLPNYKKIKKPEHRKFLAFIGETLRDPCFSQSDFWTKKINLNNQSIESIFVDDVRHPDEADFLMKNGFLIVKLEVNEERQKERALKRDGGFDAAIRNHPSEQDHLNIRPDIIIDTNNKNPDEIVEEIKKQLTPLLKLRVLIRKIIFRILNK